MNKKFLNVAMITLMATSLGSFVSCDDYDDEIGDLQEQIDAQKASLEQIKSLLSEGAVLKDVTSTAEGIKITLSNGKEYVITNGKDGKDGADGKDGVNGQDGKSDVWTIGTDGCWLKNGEPFMIDGKPARAIGVNGKDGADGKDGVNGQDGKDGAAGNYYKPNATTGNFDLCDAEGNVINDNTGISWKAGGAGVTAVLDGNMLKFYNVDGTDKEVVLYVGKALGSIAFIPEEWSKDLGLPTTTNPFYYIANYATSEVVTVGGKKVLKAQPLDKSNIVELNYRLNPTDAYLNEKGMPMGFINRGVNNLTRAAEADKADLLTFVDSKVANGTLSVNATVNHKNFISGKSNLAALQLWYGQAPVTSDYIHVTASAVDAVIANKKTTVAGTTISNDFYPRNYGSDIAAIEKEDDAFIKTFVPLTAAANLQVKYDQELNLKDYVDLYSNNVKKYITALGFDGVSFEFSLPEKYIATDGSTNQQWFVELNEGILKANSTNLTSGLTPAIGRTPVVRVDAFLNDNKGVARMVASSYIKVEILKNDPVIPSPEDLPAINIKIADAQEYEYHDLKDATQATKIGEMSWERINNELYGQSGLTAETFWQKYGGASDQYNVKLTVIDKNGAVKVLWDNDVNANAVNSKDEAGVKSEVNLNNAATTTSTIKLDVYNKVLTENTYKDIDGKGAHYTFTITVKADNAKQYHNFVFTQEFYVKEVCKTFTYNPLYYFPHFDATNTDKAIVVKGQLNSADKWEMSTKVSEHFEKIAGDNIFTYYNTTNNVSAIKFIFATGTTGVTPLTAQTADFTVKLDGAMTDRYVVKNMTYNTTLVNTETCDFDYNMVFVNPFKAGNASDVEVNGNAIGEVTKELKPQVVVLDNDNADIYTWSTSASDLVLSTKATTVYKVAAPTVNYAFDTTNADYKVISSQMSNGSVLTVDAATGKFTWKNEGSTLTKDYTLPVVATVTFADLSVVKYTINVKLKK